MIVTCPHCNNKLDLSHLATHPDLVSLVMKAMASRKRRGYNLSDEKRAERSERMATINLNRKAANNILKLPRPKKK